MYEIRRLKPSIRYRPLGMADLRELFEDYDLSDLTGLPVECSSLSEVAQQLAVAHDRQTIEAAREELEASLQERLAEQGIARHGDFVICQLPYVK